MNRVYGIFAGVDERFNVAPDNDDAIRFTGERFFEQYRAIRVAVGAEHIRCYCTNALHAHLRIQSENGHGCTINVEALGELHHVICAGDLEVGKFTSRQRRDSTKVFLFYAVVTKGVNAAVFVGVDNDMSVIGQAWHALRERARQLQIGIAWRCQSARMVVQHPIARCTALLGDLGYFGQVGIHVVANNGLCRRWQTARQAKLRYDATGVVDKNQTEGFKTRVAIDLRQNG